MESFTTLTGLVAPLGRVNVNTDEITPARFLKSIRRTGFANALFANWRYLKDGTPNPDFVLNQPRRGRSWNMASAASSPPALPTSSITTASITASCP